MGKQVGESGSFELGNHFHSAVGEGPFKGVAMNEGGTREIARHRGKKGGTSGGRTK